MVQGKSRHSCDFQEMLTRAAPGHRGAPPPHAVIERSVFVRLLLYVLVEWEGVESTPACEACAPGSDPPGCLICRASPLNWVD